MLYLLCYYYIYWSITSPYLKLYINLATDLINILLVWFMGIVTLKKKGDISGAFFKIFKFIKQLNSFWKISLCICKGKKWALSSSSCLQE